MSRFHWFVLGIMLLGAISPMAWSQDEGQKVKVLQSNRVYYPSHVDAKKAYKKIGLVDSRTVFDATPEYKEIARRGLKKSSAEYLLLCQKASKRFKKAVKRTVSQGGFDLIAETGAITVEGKALPSVTTELLANLPTGQ